MRSSLWATVNAIEFERDSRPIQIPPPQLVCQVSEVSPSSQTRPTSPKPKSPHSPGSATKKRER